MAFSEVFFVSTFPALHGISHLPSPEEIVEEK